MVVHEKKIYALMESLKIADKHVIGDLMAHSGIWATGTSAVNNSYKILTNSNFERGDGWFRVKGCLSEYKPHARGLTAALASIIKLNLNYKILREPTLKNIGLRPDALVHLQKDDKSCLMVLEVCLNELPTFLDQKVHAWQQYDAALEELSTLFQTNIKAYDIVVSGDYIPEGTFELNSYLKEIISC